MLLLLLLLLSLKTIKTTKTISWIRARTSFALLRSALSCLRGTKFAVRKSWDFCNADIEIKNTEGALY